MNFIEHLCKDHTIKYSEIFSIQYGLNDKEIRFEVFLFYIVRNINCKFRKTSELFSKFSR